MSLPYRLRYLLAWDHPDLDAVLEHIAEARRHLDAAESEA
jgi:hypothetical protein